MLADGPINSGPLNTPTTTGGGSVTPPHPSIPSSSYDWTVRMLVGGVDQTPWITGQLEIDREEGGAGVAGAVLYIDEGEEVVPTDWTGAHVEIDFISTRNGETTEARLFTGALSQPEWDPVSRLMTCAASDGLQRRVEALSVDAIRDLIPGYWSADVYESTDGRSHWDFAQELLASIPSSLDCSPQGDLRLTSWTPGQPAFVFGLGTTIYLSPRIELAEVDAITNFIEIEISYRYSRLRELAETYSWVHPGTAGIGGMGGFCLWRVDSTELPNVEMILSAASGAGQVVTSAGWYRLPPSMPDPCGTGVPWINTFNDLLLSASWTARRRWVQTVTEKYKFRLYTAAGADEASRVTQRRGSSFDIQSAESDGWADSLRPMVVSGDHVATGGTKPGFGPPGDRDDEERRVAGLRCQLATARTEIAAAHRRTTVSWDVPTNEALGVDLIHTLLLDDQGVQAQGKCRRIRHVLDLAAGSAITTLSVALRRGAAGTADPIEIPPRLGADDDDEEGGSPGISHPLGTQLGGKFDSPPYDDEQLGFAGNYDAFQDLGLERFPRRMLVESVEIPAEDTDEAVAEGEFEYRIAIPDDLLIT